MEFLPDEVGRYKKRWAFEQALNQRQRQSQQPKSSGSWFDPSSWIRELGGSGGAVAGAAMGAPLGIPGMIGGGIIGGLLGGGAGSAVEQQVRDKNIDWGKVGREGLTEGAWGVVPGLAKGVKIARFAPKGAKWASLASRAPLDETMRGIGLLDDAGKELSTRALKQGANYYDEGAKGMRAAGQRQVARARGINRGVGKTVTREGLSGKRATSINTWLDDLGIKKGSADKQLGLLESKMNGWYDDLGRELGKSNKRLAKGTIKDIRSAVDKAVAKTPGLRGSSALDDAMQKLGKVRNTKSLTEFKRSLDKAINYTRSLGSPDPVGEAGLKQLRNSVNKVLQKIAPGVDDINKNLSKAYEAQGLLQETAKKVGGQIPFVGSRTPGRFSQNLMNKAGRAMQVPSKLTFAGGQMPAFAKQVGTRGLLGGFGSPSGGAPSDDPLGLGLSTEQIFEAAQQAGLNEQELMQSLQQFVPPQGMEQGVGGFGGGQPDPMAMQMGGFQSQQQPQQMIPHEAMVQAMMADLAQTGGKNLDKLQKFYEFANANMATGNAYDNLSSTQQKEMTKLDNVEGSLAQLSQLLESAGGGQGMWGAATRNIGTKIPGVASEARVFEGFRSALIAPLARAISGEVGVLTDRDIKRAEGLLPKLSDTPYEAQMRIQQLQDIINQRRNSILQTPNADMSYQSLLTQQADPNMLGGFYQ